MKKILLIFAASILFIACTTTKEESLPDDAVARVYGEYISKDELYNKVETYKKIFSNSSNKEPNQEETNKIQQTLLSNIILKKIFNKKFDELGLTVEQGMVDAQLNAIIGSFESKEAYLAEIEKNGFKEEDYVEQIVYQFKMKELTNYIKNNNGLVSEEDIDNYYKENKKDFYDEGRIKAKASHILIKTDTLSDEEALEKIEAIKAEIENGKDFSEAAKEYSQCPSSSKGGSLGEFGPGRMVPEFDKKVFTMDLNQVSAPVKTQFGYHLILTTERVNSGYIPKEEVLDYITFQVFTDQWKEEANILRLSW